MEGFFFVCVASLILKVFVGKIMGSSSEIVESGKVSGQKSNFSQTCSLLSQYLKEKGGFGELSLGLNRSFESNGKFFFFPRLNS